MTNVNNATSVRGHRPLRSALSAAILASVGLMLASGTAQAADDTSLTWNGITLYGTVDIGIAYQNHGAPLSQDFYPGLQYAVGKSSCAT